MALSNSQVLIVIVIMALATLFTRAIPFLLFPPHRKTPAYILYLGKVLPYAVIGMLVVYCLKDVSVMEQPYGLPELVSILLVVLIYKWKRIPFLAMAGGTVLYMAILNLL